MCRDHLDNLFRDVIKRGLWPLGYLALAPPAGAIVRIVIPLATLWLVDIHQQAIALAHVAIEILHAQLFSTRRPVGKVLPRREEPAVLQDLHRDAQDV